MATYNITSTIVAYKFVPIMIENGWTLIAFNTNPTAFRSIGDGSAILTKPGEWPTRQRDGLEKGIKAKRGEENGDETAPVIQNAVIQNAGDRLRLVFNENIDIGPMGLKGMKIIVAANNLRPEFDSIQDNVLFLKLGRVITIGEVVTLTYIQPIGGVQDIAGNDLESFVDRPVINNSNQT